MDELIERLHILRGACVDVLMTTVTVNEADDLYRPTIGSIKATLKLVNAEITKLEEVHNGATGDDPDEGPAAI